MAADLEDEDAEGWFSSATVRAIVLALIVIGLAYMGKMYYGELRAPDTRAHEALEGQLEAWFQALDAQARASSDLRAFYEGLPEASSWHPEALPCGQLVRPFGSPPKDWTQAATPVPWPASWPQAMTGFQVALRKEREGLSLLARRDADCDGLYEVRRLRVKFAWGGGLSREDIVTDNAAE